MIFTSVQIAYSVSYWKSLDHTEMSVFESGMYGEYIFFVIWPIGQLVSETKFREILARSISSWLNETTRRIENYSNQMGNCKNNA